MKKSIVLALVLGVIFTGLAFAANGYVVQGVIGTVVREVSSGNWEAVTQGMTLSPSTVIDIKLNGKLELIGSTGTKTIGQMKKGTVESLVGGGGSSGLKIVGKRTQSKTSTAAGGNTNIATASTRQSDAAADTEWAE
ncbi:MAG: hypothetical protein LBQ67_01440 [Treponema sp.]|nr:hypothetical protein [Treponema sp.]